MITVAILINGESIGEISAVNNGPVKTDGVNPNMREYMCSHGNPILHDRKNGALCLAKMMLNNLDENDLKEGHEKDRILGRTS